MSGEFQKKTSSFLVTALIGLIVISFMFSGYQTMRGSPDTVAKVGDQAIKAQEFQREYDRQLQYYSRVFGGKALTSKQIETFGIQKNTLQKLINTKLMILMANRLNLLPSEDEVKATIKELPYFKSGDNFDIERYKQLLAQNRMTPSDFEQGVIVDLKLKKMGELISNSPLSNSYLDAISKMRSQRLAAQLIRIPKKDIHQQLASKNKEGKVESAEVEALSNTIANKLKGLLASSKKSKIEKLVKKHTLIHDESSVINRLDGNTKMISLNNEQVKELFAKATDKNQVAVFDTPTAITVIKYNKDNSPKPKVKLKDGELSESDQLKRELSSRLTQQVNQELLKKLQESVKVQVYNDLI
jgi:hypothetical protein